MGFGDAAAGDRKTHGAVNGTVVPELATFALPPWSFRGRLATITVEVAPLSCLEEFGLLATLGSTTEIALEIQYCGPSLG